MWIVAAFASAAFAGITAILSKCGVKNANADVATAVRTSVVLAFAWIIVFATGAHKTLAEISVKSWIFLILSGLATGASWICYFKALALGDVSKVAAVDKSHGGKNGGFGLGLAVAKKICQKSGWKISVESELGKGSKFTVEF